MITFFNDYKTFHLLKYEASIKSITVNKAMENALIDYIQKQAPEKVEEMDKGKLKAWLVIKEQSEKSNCTVAEYIEKAIVEYCGLSAQAVPKIEEKIDNKKSSFFDLNRDASRR